MHWLRPFRRQQRDEDLSREIESYIEHETQQQMALGSSRGISMEEARAAARRKFGNPTLIREDVYQMNTAGVIEKLWQDLRFAARALRKSPGFTTVALLSLALGIGANTAMFSLINTVLLRSLPYPQPEQLMRVARKDSQGAVTMAEYEFWLRNNQVFSSIGGERGTSERRLLLGTGQHWISAMTVTPGFLQSLGVQPAFGRDFTPGEARTGGPQAIVLTDKLWRRYFGGDPQALGRSVTLDSTVFTVVGILPATFWLPQPADAFVPLRPTGGLADTGTNTQLIARLKDGVTLPQAQSEMAFLSDGFRRAQTPGENGRNYRGLEIVSYQAWLVGDVRMNLLLLFGATGLLLLISCTNLATLLITRFAARGKEIAVRLALGSGRARLLSQYFMENLLIAGLGAMAGILVAHASLGGLVAWMPFNLPASTLIALDTPVLLFTVAVAALTALAFTVVPFQASRKLDLQESLKSSDRTGARAMRARARNVLVVGEIALATTLLIAAGLLIQTLNRLYQERLGFAPQGLTTFQTPLTPERRDSAAGRSNFTRAMVERLKAMPGVEGVAATNVLPLVGWANLPTERGGHPEQNIGGMEVRAVTPAYFELMGIPLRQGRPFTDRDTGTTSPVAIINETLAKTWWQGSALRDRVTIGRFRGKQFFDDGSREIVGVAADTKTILKDAPWPTVFVPLEQASAYPPESLNWIVRSRRSPPSLEAILHAIAVVDPQQRLREFQTMDQIVATTTAGSRFNASLFAIFAGLALVLASIGIYGLLSFLVNQRRQEIGTRVALGATRANVLGLFIREGIVLTAIGLALGLMTSYFLSRGLASLLYGVTTRDFLTFAAASGVLIVVALIAIYIPARRATKIDPMIALRYE